MKRDHLLKTQTNEAYRIVVKELEAANSTLDAVLAQLLLTILGIDSPDKSLDKIAKIIFNNTMGSVQ